MIRDRARRGWSWNEGLITALAVGGFFIILGSVIAFTPGISSSAQAFISDLTTVSYSLSSTNTISLVAPGDPASHSDFYTAVVNFLLAIGMLQIVILVLRLGFKSPIRRTAETVGNMIFWLGAAVVANVYLLAGTTAGWFQFWASLIIIIGISLIARFIVLLATRSYRRSSTQQ